MPHKYRVHDKDNNTIAIYSDEERAYEHANSEDLDYSSFFEEPPYYYVNVYETNKAYGGPEEGGWWYDYGVPYTGDRELAPVYGPYVNLEVARIKRRELEPIVEDRNKDRRPPDSVLCDGWIKLAIEEEPGKPWPERVPHYE